MECVGHSQRHAGCHVMELRCNSDGIKMTSCYHLSLIKVRFSDTR